MPVSTPPPTPSTNGHTSRQASPNTPAAFLAQHMRKASEREQDPALANRFNSPNFGKLPVPHVLSFASIFSTAARTYRDSDEATSHSLDNARHMRNDCGIMECLEQRQRLTALLDWHIEPEDENNADYIALCEKLEKIVRKIKRFTEYRRNLLEALWYGKYCVENSYNRTRIAGERRILPWPHPRNQDDHWGWVPISGDKLEFRFDDGKGFDDPNSYAGQMGIRVGTNFLGQLKEGDKVRDRWTVEATQRGLAYFLAPWERKMCVVHKHMIEDADWHDSQNAGRIHGVGIRSRIYWDWFQKQEALGMLMEYLERSAGGIELWYYPAGNDEAEKETRNAAENRIGNQRNIVLIPRPIGDDGMAYGVEVIEPGMAGIEQLKDLLTSYFGHRIKRYILGQILSSESEATGLGSGVADLHLDTLLSIVKFDATNLEETITDQLVTPIKDFNFPEAKNINVRFVIETESSDVAAKMEAFEKAWNMGASLKESQVMETIGAAMPDPSDKVLQNPQAGQQAMEPGGQPQPGQQPMPRIPTFDEKSLTDELMRELWGDPQTVDGQKITYVAEGGKWVQRELPGFDTGDRSRQDGEPERFSRTFDETAVNRDSDGKFAEKPDAETLKSDLQSRGSWVFAKSLAAAKWDIETAVNKEMESLYGKLRDTENQREQRRIEKDLDRLEDYMEVDLRRIPDIGYSPEDDADTIDEDLKRRFQNMAQAETLKEFAKAIRTARKDRIQELREERKPLRREMNKLESSTSDDEDEDNEATWRYGEMEDRLDVINEELHTLSDLMRSSL